MSFKTSTMKAKQHESSKFYEIDVQQRKDSCKEGVKLAKHYSDKSSISDSQNHKKNQVKQCKNESKSHKYENSLSLTFVSELDTIYEEQSVWEMSSIWTENSFFLINSEDSDSSKRFREVNECDDFTWYNHTSDIISTIIQPKRFEDRFECSKEIKSLWKKWIKPQSN